MALLEVITLGLWRIIEDEDCERLLELPTAKHEDYQIDKRLLTLDVLVKKQDPRLLKNLRVFAEDTAMAWVKKCGVDCDLSEFTIYLH